MNKLLTKIKEWFLATKELKALRGELKSANGMAEFSEIQLKRKYRECHTLEDRVSELEQLVEDAYEEGALAASLGKDDWHKSSTKLRRSGGTPTKMELISMCASIPNPERIAKTAHLVPKPTKIQVNTQVPTPA